MAINSHIQLPNSILKYFRDESDSEKKVWYLDISSGSIMKAASNKIGTSKGYYSDFGENFWNRTVEDTLAKLNHKFVQIIYVFLTIFLYLLKCPQSLILSALRAFCFCGKPHISRSIFL